MKLFRNSIFWTIITELFILLLFLLFKIDFYVFPKDYAFDILNALLPASLSVVFLSTSMIGILTSKSEHIYWEKYSDNLIKRNPSFIHLCFAGFVSIIFELCFYLMYINDIMSSLSQIGFLFSFLDGITVVVSLFYLSTQNYFSHDAIIKRYRIEFDKSEDKRLKYLNVARNLYAEISVGNAKTTKENLLFLFEYSEVVCPRLIYRFNSKDSSCDDDKNYISRIVELIYNSYLTDRILFNIVLNEIIDNNETDFTLLTICIQEYPDMILGDKSINKYIDNSLKYIEELIKEINGLSIEEDNVSIADDYYYLLCSLKSILVLLVKNDRGDQFYKVIEKTLKIGIKEDIKQGDYHFEPSNRELQGWNDFSNAGINGCMFVNLLGIIINNDEINDEFLSCFIYVSAGYISDVDINSFDKWWNGFADNEKKKTFLDCLNKQYYLASDMVDSDPQNDIFQHRLNSMKKLVELI